jgi:hypothetical protein
MKKKCIILRSVCGAGKSSFADYLHGLTTSNGRTCLICCADDFFTDLDGNYVWSQNAIGHAHLWCRHEFEEALKEGIDTIIVANTATRNRDVAVYRNLAIDAGYRVSVVTLENWHDGKDEHGVSDKIKLGMADTLRCNMRLFDMPTVEVSKCCGGSVSMYSGSQIMTCDWCDDVVFVNPDTGKHDTKLAPVYKIDKATNKYVKTDYKPKNK